MVLCEVHFPTERNQIQKINKEDNPLLFEMESKLDLLVEGQESNSNNLEGIGNELRKGFIGLALRNEKLLKSNDQLKQQLDDVLKELNAIKQEREEKAARQEKLANRKRLPKRDHINSEIYNHLIKESGGPSYMITRIAICIFTVTGIRIGEQLYLYRYPFQFNNYFKTSKNKNLRNYMIELFASLESSKRIEPGFEKLCKRNERKGWLN